MEDRFASELDRKLDRLVHSEDPDVRALVAGYGRRKDLDILVKDPDAWVRATVACSTGRGLKEALLRPRSRYNTDNNAQKVKLQKDRLLLALEIIRQQQQLIDKLEK